MGNQITGGAGYSSQRVAVTINGLPFTGFAPGGNMIEINRADGSGFNSQRGPQGNYVVSQGHDEGGTITIRFAQYAKAAIRQMKLFDDNQRNLGLSPATVLTVQVKDLNTGETWLCTECFVTSRPSAAFGEGQGERVWELGTPCIQNIVG